MNDRRAIIFIILIGLILFSLTLSGTRGNVSSLSEIKDERTPTGSLESPGEASRYLLMHSIIKDGDIKLTKEEADLGINDVAMYGKHFYSFFPPLVPISLIPLYKFGSLFDLGQVFAYFTITLFAIANLLLIYYISRKIFKMREYASILAPLIFGFATVAWKYGSTIFQHHQSVFIILTGIIAAWKIENSKNKLLWLILFWTLFGLSVYIDYPITIILSPVALYILFQRVVKTKIFWATSLLAFAIIGSNLYYNHVNFGSWNRISNSLPQYLGEDKNLRFLEMNSIEVANRGKVSTHFKLSNLPNGLWLQTISPERGIFIFFPILILGLLFLIIQRRKLGTLDKTLIALMLVNLLLYSLFRDPVGGAAFGPRYLIPSMAILAIYSAKWISLYSKSFFQKLVYFILFTFSATVAAIGANLTLKLLDDSTNFDFFVREILFTKYGSSPGFIYGEFFSHTSLVTYTLILAGIAIGIFTYFLYRVRSD